MDSGGSFGGDGAGSDFLLVHCIYVRASHILAFWLALQTTRGIGLDMTTRAYHAPSKAIRNQSEDIAFRFSESG